MRRPVVGVIVVVGLFLAFVIVAMIASGRGPCREAADAYLIANTAGTTEQQQTALTLYSLKKRECESGGGRVGW